MASAPVPPKGDRPSALRRNSIVNPLQQVQAGQKDIGNMPNIGAKGKSLSLRQKTRLIFGVALISLVGVFYTASSTIFLSSLKKAEEQETRQVVKGVLSIFAHTKNDFNSRFVDWTTWDDTYSFIQDANERYIESNLAPEQLALVKLNLVLYINSSGRLVYGTGFDSKTNKKVSVPEALRQHLAANSLLVHHSNPKSNVAGIVLLPEGPLLISSRPILTSKGEGPIRGTLIFGRYLDASGIDGLAQANRLSLTMHGLNDKIPADFQAVRSSLSVKEPILVRRLSEQIVAGYALLNDIYGKPALILRVDIPRETYKQSQVSLRYLFISLVLVGLVFGGVTLLLLERLIIFRHERQEKEERYRAVVAQASEGIFLVDAESKRFLESNAAFQNLLGYSSAEVLEMTLYDAIANEHESIDRDIQHIQTQKKHFTGEWQYHCKDGSLVDVEVSANLISYKERDTLCIVVRDITERKRTEQELRENQKRLSWQASHDPLTELVNRREFEHRLEQFVSSAKTLNHQHALLYLDLDQFKIVNDTCGHAAGDALLRQVSNLLQTELRKTDILARLGGDEFGILLYDCPLEPAVKIANALRERIQEFRFNWKYNIFSIGVSIGLVVIDANTQNLASVLSAADTACYAAKNKGRNRVILN